MTELKELSIENLNDIKTLFKEVFMAPPWNDDWSDDNQLTEYILDMTANRKSLAIGLYDHNELFFLLLFVLSNLLQYT